MVALVDALADGCAALGLGGGRIVKHKLPENGFGTIRSIGPDPLSELVDAGSDGAVGSDWALEKLADAVKAVGRPVEAEQLGGLGRLGGVGVDLCRGGKTSAMRVCTVWAGRK